MEPAAILDELMRSQDLPREALRAAAERRADMVPLFVEQIETYLQTGTTRQANDAPLFFIFHLLGDWRETSAYRALARLLRCPSNRIDAAIAECITETAHRVMAAVFDGDPGPLYNIVLDENADEFVRSRMCDTLAMLVVQGRLDRAEVASFLRDCWINLQPRDCSSFVWHGWQNAVALLGLVELKDIVREAFDREIIDPSWLDYQDFEDDLALALLKPTEPWHGNRDEYELFGDTIEELSTWYGFSEEYQRERARLRDAPPPPPALLPPSEPPGRHVLSMPDIDFLAGEPIRNPMRGVGRNDPCPCGSGMKYKKCCLQ